MGQNNSVRSAYIKWLRLFFATCRTSGWISHLSNTSITNEAAHIASSKDISHQAIGFVHCEGIAVHRCDTGCILSTMLQKQQCVIEKLIYW